MTDKNLPSIEYLHKRLRYEPETGKLFWRDCDEMPKKWRTRWTGREAFTAVRAGGYLQGKLLGMNVRAHRAIWALCYGEWPKQVIDHINGNPSDNRIQNLRDVSVQENSKNQTLRPNNTSGFCGVNLDKRSGRWRATIRIGGRKKELGYFHNIDDAVAARRAAAKDGGYTGRHGTLWNTWPAKT